MTTQVPDVEILNPETPAVALSSDPSPADSRCLHRYDNGTRCRHRGSQSQFGLCPRHFRLKVTGVLPQAPDDSADLTQDLFPNGNGFRTTEDVREFLTHVLVLMTKGRVSPRRAAVLAYVTTQLLHSHCAVQKEEKEELANEPIIFDLPRPKYDEETAS